MAPRPSAVARSGSVRPTPEPRRETRGRRLERYREFSRLGVSSEDWRSSVNRLGSSWHLGLGQDPVEEIRDRHVERGRHGAQSRRIPAPRITGSSRAPPASARCRPMPRRSARASCPCGPTTHHSAKRSRASSGRMPGNGIAPRALGKRRHRTIRRATAKLCDFGMGARIPDGVGARTLRRSHDALSAGEECPE